MKFAIKYSDIINYKDILINILNKTKTDITKIYVIFDSIDEDILNDLEKKKKFSKKCEKKLKSIKFPFDYILLINDVKYHLNDVCKRNYIDVLLTSNISETTFISDPFIKTINIKNDYLYKEITDYIKNCNIPISNGVNITKSPSLDKIYLKYYNKKELSDYKRFSLQKESLFERIKYNNYDFMYETALEIFGTDTKISYQEFVDNIEKYKAKFKENQIEYGDVVTIMCPNVLASVYSIFALMDIGAIPSMVHVFTKEKNLNRMLKDENSKAIIMIEMEEVYHVVKEAIKNTDVKKVITIPLTDSLSFKYQLGIKLINSKFFKFAINTLKSGNKYVLNKENKGIKAYKNIVTQLFADFNKTKGNFKVIEDETFIQLESFLSGSFEPIESTPNEIALIIHTGGSTADPKAVLLTHENLNSNIDQFEATIQNFKRGDKMISIPPIFHILGFNNCLYLPLRSGIKAILVSKYNKNKLKQMFELKPEYFFGVPKIGRDLLKQDLDNIDMSNLKYMVYGGEEMDSKFLKDITALILNHNGNIKASQSLGASEATCSMTNTFNNCNEIGSLGIPLIGLDVKVVKIKNETDPDYDVIEELGYNEVGELCFSGNSIMYGYLQDEFNKTTLRKHPDGKIWLHTFDAGYINEKGLIYFEDRIKDMIKINGEQVYTSEIKKIITSHPWVEKCAITCVLDKDEKKNIIATITLKIELFDTKQLEENILKLCKDNLIKEAVPKKIEIRKSMPETMYLKIDSKKLTEEYQAKQKKLSIREEGNL